MTRHHAEPNINLLSDKKSSFWLWRQTAVKLSFNDTIVLSVV